MFFVKGAPTTYCSFDTRTFRSPLARAELSSGETLWRIVRIDRRQRLPPPFIQESEVDARASQPVKGVGLAIGKQRNQIVTRRSHARILMIDNANLSFLVNQQIRRMVIAMAQHARDRCQFISDIIKLDS